MAVYEGKWRCPACQAVNLGRHTHCQSCGYKADDSVEYFLDSNPAQVNNPQLLQMSQEENWICNHCQGQNRAGTTQCESCSNKRDTDDKELTAEIRGSVSDWQESSKPAQPTSAPQTPAPQGSAIAGCLVIIVPILIILTICGYCGSQDKNDEANNSNKEPSTTKFSDKAVTVLPEIAGAEATFNFNPREINVEVFGLEWKTTVEVEEYKTLTESNWKSLLPQDAKILSEERQIRTYEDIQIGTETVYEEYKETVPDGVETYTETVSDGRETYTETETEYESYSESVPETEEYKCGVKNKKNGFFEDVYCTRTVYKTVYKKRPVTKTVTKTRLRYKEVTKTRPRYKEVTKTRPKEKPVHESRPIYDTKVSYQVNRWITTDSLKADGKGFNPSWATIEETSTKRAGKKSGEYNLLLRNPNLPEKIYTRIVKEPELTKYPQGAVLRIKVDSKNELLSFEDTAENQKVLPKTSSSPSKVSPRK